MATICSRADGETRGAPSAITHAKVARELRKRKTMVSGAVVGWGGRPLDSSDGAEGTGQVQSVIGPRWGAFPDVGLHVDEDLVEGELEGQAYLDPVGDVVGLDRIEVGSTRTVTSAVHRVPSQRLWTWPIPTTPSTVLNATSCSAERRRRPRGSGPPAERAEGEHRDEHPHGDRQHAVEHGSRGRRSASRRWPRGWWPCRRGCGSRPRGSSTPTVGPGGSASRRGPAGAP